MDPSEEQVKAMLSHIYNTQDDQAALAGDEFRIYGYKVLACLPLSLEMAWRCVAWLCANCLPGSFAGHSLLQGRRPRLDGLPLCTRQRESGKALPGGIRILSDRMSRDEEGAPALSAVLLAVKAI